MVSEAVSKGAGLGTADAGLDFAALAPQPRTLQDTGLSRNLLHALIAKHLYDGGVMDLQELAGRLMLSGNVLEPALGELRGAAAVEVRGASAGSAGLRYALTDRGRTMALEAFNKSGYLGPAPLPLAQYTRIVAAQSVHTCAVTAERMQAVFAKTVIRANVLEALGPATHSGRAIFIYGLPGAGKTYIAKRLAELFPGPVLVPWAICVDEEVVGMFDAVVHQPLDEPRRAPSPLWHQSHDARLLACRRPAVMSGGELTLDMLEIAYHADTRLQFAPLQLKANNGVYVIDDFGRQRVAPVDLLNRWIVPMQDRQDYLTSGAGRRFPVPFDTVLVFSTNLDPLALADEAFLRRLGYKIRFDALEPHEYTAIWRDVCAERGIPFEPQVLDYVIKTLHGPTGTPLLPCHPGDLLGMAHDLLRYRGGALQLSTEVMDWVWARYFVRPLKGESMREDSETLNGVTREVPC